MSAVSLQVSPAAQGRLVHQHTHQLRRSLRQCRTDHRYNLHLSCTRELHHRCRLPSLQVSPAAQGSPGPATHAPATQVSTPCRTDHRYSQHLPYTRELHHRCRLPSLQSHQLRRDRQDRATHAPATQVSTPCSTDHYRYSQHLPYTRAHHRCATLIASLTSCAGITWCQQHTHQLRRSQRRAELIIGTVSIYRHSSQMSLPSLQVSPAAQGSPGLHTRTSSHVSTPVQN